MRADPEVQKQIDRPVTTLAVAFLSAIAGVQLYVVPITVGAAVSGRGFSEKQVGDALGIAGLFYVLIVAASPVWIARWDWRWICGLAVGLSAGSAIGLTQTTGYLPYILLQAVQSACLALMFPPIMCALGASAEPEKKYGIALLLQSLLAAAMIYFLKASVLPLWGFDGVYGVLAAYATLGFSAVAWIPARGSFERPSGRGNLLKKERLVLLGLVALCLYYVSVNGFTSFSERYGEHFGVRGGVIASALAIGILLSAAGSAFVALVGNRWGRVKPMLGAMLIALTGYGVLFVEPRATYFVGVCLINLSIGVIIAYAYATVAAADTSGRFTGMVTAAAGLGIAAAVTLMGRVISAFGYQAFSLTLMAITAGAIALMMAVAHRVVLRDRAQESG